MGEMKWNPFWDANISSAMGQAVQESKWLLGLFVGLKWPRRGIDRPPAFSADFKEKVELYHYFTSGPSWPV